MNEHDLNREIAQVTGESVATIAAMGFGLLMMPKACGLGDQRPRLRAVTAPRPRKAKTGKTFFRVRRRKKPTAPDNLAPAKRSRGRAA